MPLNTEIRRDGKRLPVRWGEFHVVAMTLAAAWDHGDNELAAKVPPPEAIDLSEEPCPITPGNVWNLMGYHVIGATPLNKGSYTLKGTWAFLDVTDGEVFELLPGDVLRAWRD